MPRYLVWVEEYKRYAYYVEADNKAEATQRGLDLACDDVEPDLEGDAGGDVSYVEEVGEGVVIDD